MRLRRLVPGGYRLRQVLVRVGRAQGGASAVEFAFIAPVLLLLFVATIEIPRAIATNNRLAQATITMADLASKSDYADINDVFSAAQVVASPYSLTGIGIVLTAGGVYQAGNDFVARVCSSVQQGDTARAVGSDIGPPPAGTASKGDRFVMAETRLPYRPLFSFFPFLNDLTFTAKTVWPVREGIAKNGQVEVVLPGGNPCPA
ncbi:MAG TPA: TadE/TadG family type IV pilus assembly protein [Methylobacterium sp.]|jgi:Flp pilus assembly protein TadG|uniref:TadE/TadG family type IV pilus assembly protein n=1 Tax=Methylorubrum sp. B1-46 TaxID=2897334 RepID=UPI001E5961FE|nr:TadE/TadG family type IV pilus assembly protein [Methylorubrum sp. B1-46]UGB24672.1 pilus assembly protein [Methylorubrum sp. B1-46]HEV2545218.1 TadE/TadG family type IV pilus assembly protein [Methylobacterium sp.]